MGSHSRGRTRSTPGSLAAVGHVELADSEALASISVAHGTLGVTAAVAGLPGMVRLGVGLGRKRDLKTESYFKLQCRSRRPSGPGPGLFTDSGGSSARATRMIYKYVMT